VQAASRRYAVLSLLADQLDLVYAQETTGSMLDRNRRESFEAGAGAFDRYALQAVHAAVQRIEAGTQVTMLALPTTSRQYNEPDGIFTVPVVSLPGNVVDALIAAQATHLILLTKLRGAARIPLVEQTTGMGTVRGVGFYVDRNLALRRVDTGELTTGVLAPFAYVRLSLVDVQNGQLARDRSIRAMRAYTPAGRPVAVPDPWELLSAREKAEALKTLLEQELAREVPLLLGGG
jgi:hypothetical protein